MSKSFFFWQRWLLVLSLLIILFGLFMAFASPSPWFELFHRQVDPTFWGEQTLSGQAAAFRGWVYGLLGATMAGWGVFFYFLSRHGLPQRQRWVWNCLLYGMLLWFISDTALSWYYGVMFNVLFNSVLLLLVLLPLLAIRKAFWQENQPER